MSQQASLLLLLSLYNDPATEFDEQGRPAILRSQADHARWQKLCELLEASDNPIGDEFPAEAIVAAYVEGQLSQSEADAVESICWSNHSVMQEVAEIHRELQQPLPAPPLSQTLTDRLLDLPTEASASHLPGGLNGRHKAVSPADPQMQPGTEELRALLQGGDASNHQSSSRLLNRGADAESGANGARRRVPGRETPGRETPNRETPVRETPGREIPQSGGSSAASAPQPPPVVADDVADAGLGSRTTEAASPAPPPAAPPIVDHATTSKVSLADSRRNASRSMNWLTLTSAVTLLAILLAVLWFSFGGSGGDSPQPHEIALPPELEQPLEPRDVGPQPNSPQSPDVDSQANPNNVKDVSPTPEADRSPGAPSGPEKAPVNDRPKLNPPPQDPPLRRPTPSYRALAIDWQEVEGLVMARADVNENWQGAKSDQLGVEGNTFVTLPGSWAQATADLIGSFVMDSDTQMSMESKGDNLASVRLDRGRLAITETPQESDYEMVVGGQPFALHAQKSAAFAIVQSAPGPQVWVRRGEVKLKNVTLRKGQRARWLDGAFKTEALKEGTAWFDRAPREGIARLDSEAKSRLLSSHDVHAELIRLSSHSDPALRRIALSWNLIVDPGQHLYSALRSPDAALRLQASAWLLSQVPRDTQFATVWRRLARQSGDSAKMRHIASWKAQALRKTPPRLTDAQQMIQGLSHNDPAIRQLSIFFLELNFGARVKFSPVANPASQRRAIGAWTQFVRQRYANQGQR